jgi:hypothetical protein
MISIAALIPMVAVYLYVQHLQDKIKEIESELTARTAERDAIRSEYEGYRKTAQEIGISPAKKE